MTSPLAHAKYWPRLAQSLAALFAAAVAIPTTTRAVTITNLVETSTSLSFDFRGTDHFDVIISSLPALSFWNISSETHNFPAAGPFLLSLSSMEHLGGPSGSVSISGAYGTTQTNTTSFAHAAGLDVYTLTATVNGVPGGPGWSSYSGSFSAVHVNAPDGGSTAALAGLAALLLAGARRVFGTA